MTEKRYESDLTRKEKRQLEWEKIKNMSWKDRMSHIWAYYKPHMAVALMIIVALSVIGQIIYRSQFETILSVAILNAGTGDTKVMAEDFKNYLGDEDKYHEISIDTSMFFTGDEQSDYTSVMKITTLVGAQEIDVVLANEDQFQKYQKMDAFLPMGELLTEEQKSAYGDRVSDYGIRITESGKLDEFGVAPGEDTYLAVFVYSEHVDYAKSFITYICEGGES